MLFTHLCGTIPKLYWKMPRPRKTTGANPAIEVRKSWMLLRTEPSLLSSCENTSNQKMFPRISNLVIDGGLPKGEGGDQGDAAPERQLDKPLLLVQDQPHLDYSEDKNKHIE